MNCLKRKTSFFFDLDGTLVDSSGCHEQAFLTAMEKHAPTLTKNFSYEDWKGFRTEAVFRALGVEDQQLVQSLTIEKQRNYRDKIESGAVQLIPFATELLDYLAGKNYRLFVVTSASRASSQRALTNLNIARFFQATVSGDDVGQAKPAPDCYKKCVQLCGAELKDALAIEDAQAGLESARSAGLDVVLVNNSSLAHLKEYVGSLEQLHKRLVDLEEII